MQNFLNKGGLAVPSKGSKDNSYMMDVVGSKQDTPNSDSLYSNSTVSAGKPSAKLFTLDGNGPQNDNWFIFNGTVDITEIGIQIAQITDITTLSTCYFDVYDGTNQIDVTASAGTDLSGATVESYAFKNGDNTVALALQDSSQVRLTNEGKASLRLTAKNGVANYIRFNFTGDANTNVMASSYIRYIPVSANGTVSFV